MTRSDDLPTYYVYIMSNSAGITYIASPTTSSAALRNIKQAGSRIL